MPSQRRNLPEQEHSIKERAQELFIEPPRPELGSKPTKPFPVYLRETPAQPFSPFTKVVFWIVGIIVAALFLAALWRVTHRRGSAPRPRSERPPTGEVRLRDADRISSAPPLICRADPGGRIWQNRSAEHGLRRTGP